MKLYYIYILASQRNGTLYIGVTSNLIKRIYEHKQGLIEGFTKKYNVHQLVYYETTPDIKTAIVREKQLKGWKRQWKIELIERQNPKWRIFIMNWLVDICIDSCFRRNDKDEEGMTKMRKK